MEEEECSNCKFWKWNPEIDTGQCHRYAPRLIVAGCGVGEGPEYAEDWCVIKTNEWCGEYQEKVRRK